MKHHTPKVYIGGQLMDDYATSNRPVLEGMSITFGVESDLDMQTPETASFELLVREAEDLTFIDLGRLVAIVHIPQGDEPGSDAFTYFMGRIQRCTAVKDDNIAGAIRYTVECSDLLTDLENTPLYDVSVPAENGTSRLAQVKVWLESEGWTPRTINAEQYPNQPHAEIHFQQSTILERIDAFLRGQVMLRRHTSYYSPPTDSVVRRLDVVHDSSQNTRADQLVTLTGGERWGRRVGSPYYTGSTMLYLDGKDVLTDGIEWTKEPDDITTDVTLDLIRPPVYDDTELRWEDSEYREISARSFIDTSAARNEFGTRTAAFETDLQSVGIAASHVTPIFNRWLTTETQWRVKSLPLYDSERLDGVGLRALLDPRERFTTYVIVRGLMDNRPDMKHTDIRGFCIGGTAVWNGKWDITITLGRPPGLAETADYWTCALLAADPVFSAGQCNTVGDELSCNDFLRIGA